MKKIILIILTFSILVTGCTNKEETKKVKKEDSLNLVTETNPKEEIQTEEEIVTYMDQIENEVAEITEKETITKTEEKTLKNTFVTLTDFIFYDGEIKGKKFSELTYASKEKILSIYESIDQKIETKFPRYKETIKEQGKKVYSTAKEKAQELKETIQNKYKDYVGEEKYNNTIKAYEEDKSNVKEVYDTYKPAIDSTKEKAKETYQTAKEKVSSWYQEWKES